MRRPLIALALVSLPLVWSTTTASEKRLPSDDVVVRPGCFEAQDSDSDGIPDSQDQCPTLPEVFNGLNDHDGCPDELSLQFEVHEEEDAPAAALTDDVLSNLPAGRNYQSAVPSAPGTTGSAPKAKNKPPRGPKKSAPATAPAAEANFAGAPPPAPPIAPLDPTPHEERKTRRDTTTQAVLDWGARIFLSNDDSMSLASAQRVIYALQNQLPVDIASIRPHELLNYFSFDVAQPTEKQLFDVAASAEQRGDTLSVALSVQGASPEPLPLDLTLVVDVSCSMEEDGRMDYTQRGLLKMTDQLKRGDRVDVVMFDDAVCTPLENFVVGRDDPRLLTDTIQRLAPDGATNLDLGLREGYRVARAKRDVHQRNRRVMVLTDAELNTGDVDPHTVSDIGAAFDDAQIRLTGVGVGRTFRDDVLDRLTEKGHGAYVFLGSEAVVDRVFGTGLQSLVQTIAHDVQFELDLPDSLAMERFYGEEASTVAADIEPIHYYAGTSQVFLQDLRVRSGRVAPKDPIRLTIRYREADTGEPAMRIFHTTVGEMLAADQHNVRKAHALMAWTDLLQVRAMGGAACGEPLQTYASRAAQLTDDAEIAFVNGLVTQICGAFDLPSAVAAAPLKVRIDSDQPIAQVSLSCGGVQTRQALSGSDTVARFDATPGSCRMTLAGVVDLSVDVEVPEGGRDLRCTVRAGRVHCG